MTDRFSIDDLEMYITCPLLFFARKMEWWRGPHLVEIVRQVVKSLGEYSVQDGLIAAWERFAGLQWAAGAIPALEETLMPYLEGKIRREDGLAYVSPMRSPGFQREAMRHGYLEWRQRMEKESPGLLPLFEESVLAMLRWARYTNGYQYHLEHQEISVGDSVIEGDLLVGKRNGREIVEVMEYTAASPEDCYEIAIRIPVHLAVRREGEFLVAWNNLRTGRRIELHSSSLREIGDIFVLAAIQAAIFGIRARLILPRSMALTGECVICAARERCKDLAGLVISQVITNP